MTKITKTNLEILELPIDWQTSDASDLRSNPHTWHNDDITKTARGLPAKINCSWYEIRNYCMNYILICTIYYSLCQTFPVLSTYIHFNITHSQFEVWTNSSTYLPLWLYSLYDGIIIVYNLFNSSSNLYLCCRLWKKNSILVVIGVKLISKQVLIVLHN